MPGLAGRRIRNHQLPPISPVHAQRSRLSPRMNSFPGSNANSGSNNTPTTRFSPGTAWVARLHPNTHFMQGARTCSGSGDFYVLA